MENARGKHYLVWLFIIEDMKLDSNYISVLEYLLTDMIFLNKKIKVVLYFETSDILHQSLYKYLHYFRRNCKSFLLNIILLNIPYEYKVRKNRVKLM